MRPKPRVVLDTNVVVSALFWGGKPFDLMTLADERAIRLFASPPLLAELEATLAKRKLARALAASGKSIADHTAGSSRSRGPRRSIGLTRAIRTTTM